VPAGSYVKAGPEWRRFAQALDRAPASLRTQARVRMAAAARVGVEAAHHRAASILPRHGGLADLVAQTPIVVDLDDIGGVVRVRIFVKGRDPGIDRGKFRHPVYGHRDRWAAETVQPGWFSDPMRELAPEMRSQLTAALHDVVRLIAEEAR